MSRYTQEAQTKWKLQTPRSQILPHYQKVADKTVDGKLLTRVNLQDRKKRSLLAEVPRELLFLIASYLDINTITMGMALISCNILFILGDDKNPPAEFSRLRIFRKQSLAENYSLPSFTSESSPSPQRVYDLMSQIRSFTRHYRYAGPFFYADGVPSQEQLKNTVSLFRAEIPVSNGNCYQMENLRYMISSISITEIGNRVALGSENGDLEIFDLRGNRLSALNYNDSFVAATAFSFDGQLIAVGTAKRNEAPVVRLIAVDSEQLLKEVGGLSAPASKIVFNHTGSLMAMQCMDGNVFVIDPSTAKIERHINFATQRPVEPAIAFSSDGKLLACSSPENNSVTVFNTTSWEEIFELRHPALVTAIAFSADGEFIVTGSRNRSVYVWNLQNGKADIYQGHESSIQDVAFSADSKKIITLSFNSDLEMVYQSQLTHNAGTLKIWDVVTKECETRQVSRSKVISKSITQGEHILLGHEDGTLTHFRLSPMVRQHKKVSEEETTNALRPR